MSSPTRVLALAMDGTNPDLIARWADDGTLPAIAALRARGLSGRTRGVEGFFVGSTWPSLMTGTSPASHGIHYLVQLVPGSYRFHRPSEGAYLQARPFWEALCAAGKRVAILDVPLSPLSPAMSGIQVVEWGGHDAVYGFRTSPPELEGEIMDRFGPHPLGPTCDAPRRTAEEYGTYVDRLVQGVEAKGRLTAHLLARGGWDLFLQVFTEGHCCGHQCWHLHDPTHPAHEPAITARIGNPLKRVYQAMDAEIGKLVAMAPEAPVLVFISHGMSHWYGAHFLLKEILIRLGVTATRPPAPPTVRARLRQAAQWGWGRLPEPARAVLRPLRGRPAPAGTDPSRFFNLGVDTRASRCFPVHNGLAVGGIRLNLAGREPDGILTPGAEADAFCSRLEADLMAILDERTGRPLIGRVLRTAALYQGPHLDALPDLLVEWSNEVPTGSTAVGDGGHAVVRATSPRIGVVEGVNSYGRTGEHRPVGWFVAAGPSVPPGRLEEAVSVMDLAPTMARLAGVGLEQVDGTPIAALWNAPRP